MAVHRDLPAYHGMAPVEAQARSWVASRALWDLHGKLTANQLSIITGVYGQAAAQIRGLGGNGKSLLAREYSIPVRFGVPWRRVLVECPRARRHEGRCGPSKLSSLRRSATTRSGSFAIQVGRADGRSRCQPEIEASLWRAIRDARRTVPLDRLTTCLPGLNAWARWKRAWNAALGWAHRR